jgi:hypothetical protein
MASRAREFQKKTVFSAAGAAVLGVAPMLAMAHGHRWLGFGLIGVQVVLVVMAIRFLFAMQRARSAGQ